MATLTFILFFFWAAAMVLSLWAAEVARMFARRTTKAAGAPRPPRPPNLPIFALPPEIYKPPSPKGLQLAKILKKLSNSG